MTFELYMTFCLYHPEFGYYVQGRERTGVAGDYFQFRSAPDSLFRFTRRRWRGRMKRLRRLESSALPLLPAPADGTQCPHPSAGPSSS